MSGSFISGMTKNILDRSCVSEKGRQGPMAFNSERTNWHTSSNASWTLDGDRPPLRSSLSSSLLLHSELTLRSCKTSALWSALWNTDNDWARQPENCLSLLK